MTDAHNSLFFPILHRRANYSAKADGTFYGYQHFRTHFHHEIAEDCVCRCVYCDSHENDMGGRDSMQIDHFRPYTRTGFENLEDVPHNFHHACGRCNLLKSDKWPSTHETASHDGIVGFIDPFTDNRSLYFSVIEDGHLKPLRPPAEYLIRVLALNRPHLRLLRTRRVLLAELKNYFHKNCQKWEDAANGKGGMTIKELGTALLKCKRLIELCSL